jgi:transcriptional regulator with XRE-family HTH domain
MARRTELDATALDPTTYGFGPLLRRHRVGLGLTQRVLADLSTISVRTIRDLEQGRARPRADTVRLISDALRLGRQGRADLLQAAGRGAAGRPLGADYDVALAAPPVVLTTLVGREAEVGTLVAELTAGTTRLTTVVGPPGVGKTRLVVEAATVLHDQSRLPVLWLTAPDAGQSLGQPARDGRLADLLHAATTALFAPDDGAALAELVDLIGSRDTLLVVDGVGARPLLGSGLLALLRDCPRLRALVTADELTGLPGERPFLLAALAVPATDAAVDAADVPAVRLFLDHLRRVRPGDRLTATDTATVVEICGLLDGLPPAIASAASWLTVYDLEPLRDALFTDPYPLLDRAFADRLTDWVTALPAAQRVLLDRLRDLGEVTMDAVASATGNTVPETGQLLRDLLLRGVIRLRQTGGQTRFQVLSLVAALARVDDPALVR